MLNLFRCALLGLGVLASSSVLANVAQWFELEGEIATVEQDKLRIKADQTLLAKGWLGDQIVEFEYKLDSGAELQLYLLSRYALILNDRKAYENDVQNSGSILGRTPEQSQHAAVAAATPGEWQSVKVEFRTARYDEANNKTDSAMFVSASVNGKQVQFNAIVNQYSEGSLFPWEETSGQLALKTKNASVQVRNFHLQKANFDVLALPKASGEASNREAMLDLVGKGGELFQEVGCAQCHAISEGDTSAKTGPNLFGLFHHTPREHTVEQGEGHRFSIKADAAYFKNSLRSADFQKALQAGGQSAYPPIMPSYPEQIVGPLEERALYAYLMTLNSPWNAGPALHLADPGDNSQYDVLEDRFQFIVSDRTRMQRGPMEGVSARSIHVGSVAGIHYSFDPRTLSVSKVWQGGYLDASGELRNRGGKGFKLGYQSQEVKLGEMGALIQPLLDAKDAQSLIDFSFKEAVWQDTAAIKESLYSSEDQAERIAKIDAQFKGYEIDSRNKTSQPIFKFRVGKNQIGLQHLFADSGTIELRVSGKVSEPQAFLINEQVLSNVQVDRGGIENGVWTLPAGGSAVLKASIPMVKLDKPELPEFAYDHQPLERKAATAELPKGYEIESYMPPLDNLGREQLFEALGMAESANGTIVVSTRTAGVWHLKKDRWQQFAQGTFDSLGLLVEDKKGLDLIVGQKAELSRIRDINGDGIADVYETLFDAHSYHGNYHSYMHGPARAGNDEYIVAINLAHADEAIYKADGKYMGTQGGYAGWAIKVNKKGEHQLWANGLRSPASVGTSPDGEVYYADNQGEFMGTSQMYRVNKGDYYGHPSGLVDLPGMTPDSDEIHWLKFKPKRAKANVLFPHNRLANSPGNPAWEGAKAFGPNSGDMYIGDQTQSNLLRVGFDEVNGQQQGYVLPFIAGLESGVMRPVFLKDGSLLLGQTGRGWQAKGGQIASMQRVSRVAKLEAMIESIRATSSGFEIVFSQAVSSFEDGVSVDSWAYSDTPDYGSPERGNRQEAIKGLSWSNDRTLNIELAELRSDRLHEAQSAWVYYIKLPGGMEAYYSAYAFPQ